MISVADFAARIKEKYPAYASVPDDELALRVVSKHPEYKAQVSFDVRGEQAFRDMNPPATAMGDPNQQGLSGGDIAGAAGKGLAHLAGIPTSLEELKGAGIDAGLNGLTMGTYGATKAAVGAVGDVMQGRVPIVGKVLADVAAPARAVMNGRPPTRDENLSAIESGTSLAGLAALQHPAVAGAMGRVIPQAGAALEEAGTAQYADALAPRGAAQRPLAETLSSQLAGKGKVLTDPKTQLSEAFGGYETTGEPIAKFAKSASAEKQLAALQEKFPNAQVVDDGRGNFLIRERSPEQIGADSLAKGVPKQASGGLPGAIQKIGTRVIGGGVGGAIGAAFGGPVGAAIGTTAAEGIMAVKSLMRSPLWKTTAGGLKTMVGRAMQAQDFATVTNIAARVLAGENLDDAYGHDRAFFGLIQSLGDDPSQMQQKLEDYDAMYVNHDGTAVEVPRHVTRQTFHAITN